jgi:PAS domain S-box-containing protein
VVCPTFAAWEGRFTLIAVFEAVGLLACLVGVFYTLKARTFLSSDGRITLLGLLGTVALVHGLDLVEWTIYEPADRLGDIFKILTPAAWLFFLFVVRRDGLVNKVEEQEQHLDFFFAYAPIAVVIVDRDRRIVACSQRWIELHHLCRSPVGETLDGFPTNDRNLAPDEAWSAVWGEVVRASLKKSAPRKGVHHFTDGGESAWVEWYIRPWSRDNEISGAILMVEPITERVEQQRERERTQAKLLKGQALETVGEIATGVAHDVNNLLQVIGAHAELLSYEDGTPEEIIESLGSIRQAVGTASGMTRWLLAFGRQDSVAYQEVDPLSNPSKLLYRPCRRLLLAMRLFLSN